MVQWLRLWVPNVGGLSSILGQGTRFHLPQLKIPHAETKTWSSQIKKKKTKKQKKRAQWWVWGKSFTWYKVSIYSLGPGHLYRFPRQEPSWFQQNPKLSWDNDGSAQRSPFKNPALANWFPSPWSHLRPCFPCQSLWCLSMDKVKHISRRATQFTEATLEHRDRPTPNLPCLYHETLPHWNRYPCQSRISDFLL